MVAVVKSDAMIQHEKWITWVLEHNPKRGKDYNPLPEAKDVIAAIAVIVVVVAAALAIIR